MKATAMHASWRTVPKPYAASSLQCGKAGREPHPWRYERDGSLADDIPRSLCENDTPELKRGLASMDTWRRNSSDGSLDH